MASGDDQNNSDKTNSINHPHTPTATHMGDQELSSARQNTDFPLKRFITLISTIGVLLIAMIIYSAETGLRMSQRYTPLINAVTEIKLQAAIGHLWFEEILSNDQNEDIEQVRYHLKHADWYIQAMLEGAESASGKFMAMDDPELRRQIEGIRALLMQFRTQMEQRWRDKNTSGPGTPIDQSFDLTFNTFIQKADIVKLRLQDLIKTAERQFIIVQIIMALLTLVVTTILGWLFMRFADAQGRAMADLTTEIAQRKRIEDVLREQATTDTLTGLLNRRSITDILQDELNRAQRLNTSFSIIMFDIDHFKQVNDNHGHEVGDTVLKIVAKTVKSRLREVDALARWGGEEFLILLPGTELEGALALSDTCRQILADTPIEDVGQVTASFGVASHNPDESIRALIHRADDALYEAKNAGRNRVEMAQQEAN